MALTENNIKSRYGAGALVYDEVMEGGWRSLIDRRRVVTVLGSTEDARYLEIGVGTGLNIPYYPKGTVWSAIDLTPEMLKVARNKGYVCSSVDLREMSGSSLLYDTSRFCGVLATLVVSACEEPLGLLREALRVTVDGGRLSLLDVTRSRIDSVVRLQEELVAPYSESSGFPAPSERWPGGVIVYTPLRDMVDLVEEAGWQVELEERLDEENPFTCRSHIVARKL